MEFTEAPRSQTVYKKILFMSLCPKVKIFTVAIKLKEQAHTLSNVGAAVDRDFVFKHLWFCRKMLQLLFIEQLQKSFCG